MSGLASWKAAIVASSKGFWKVEPEPLRVADEDTASTAWTYRASPGANSPGPSLDGAEFLIKHGARVVGDDTLTFEQRPPIVTSPKFQVFPVHMRVIADSGIFIIENLNLEELAQAKAYEFAVVVPPLRILGGTGSALRAFALVPRDD